MSSSIFANKIWFYPLFAAVIDYFYGLDAPLTSSPIRPMSTDIGRALQAISAKYSNHDALDDATLKLVTGRSNRKSHREQLTRLISKKL